MTHPRAVLLTPTMAERLTLEWHAGCLSLSSGELAALQAIASGDAVVVRAEPTLQYRLHLEGRVGVAWLNGWDDMVSGRSPDPTFGTGVGYDPTRGVCGDVDP